MVTIPTLSDGTPFYTVTVQLENFGFTFDFSWNEREGSWYFDIYNGNNSLILSGIKVTLSVPLLGKFVIPGVPPGDIMAIDTSNTDTMPGITDLGVRVLLTYITQADLAQIAAGTFNPNA